MPESSRQPGAPPAPRALTRRSWAAPLAIFLLALAVRAIHLLAIKSTLLYRLPLGDGVSYDTWARKIAAGDWIGSTTFYQAPLYPYFLGTLYWMFGPDVAVARIAQLFVGAATCVLFADAARSYLGRRAQWIVGITLALYPSLFFFDLIIQKSVLDLFFLGLALAALGRIDRTRPPLRSLPALLLGAALACLTLTRENAILLIPVVFAWVLWRRRTRPRAELTRWAFLATLGIALLLFPVALRNKKVGGEFHLTTSQLGPNLYIGNNPAATGSYVPLRPGRGSFLYEREDAVALAQAARGRALTPGEVSGYWIEQVVEFIRHEPGRWLTLMGKKTLLLFNRVESADTEDQYAFTDWSPLLRVLTPVLHYGLLVPLAFAGAVLLWPRRRRVGVVFLVAGTYGASVVIFYVFARYRLPLTPLLVMLAAGGVARVLAIRRRGYARAAFRPAVLAALAAGAALANVPVGLTQAQMRSSTYDNIALELSTRPGFAAQAETFYRRALECDPARPGVHNNLAVLLKSQARWAEAIEHFRLAILASPQNADLHYNLGLCLAQTGSSPAAIESYRRAISIAPNVSSYHNNLGNALGDAGRPGEAAIAFLRAIELDPRDPKPHYNFGSLLARSGQVAQGIESLRRAVALDPNYADAYYNLGNAALILKRRDEAVDSFERYLRLVPGDRDATLKLQAARQLPAVVP